MKKIILASTAVLLLSTSGVLAAGKSYPLVGRVTEITSSKITIQTPNKKTWEIARDSSSKVESDVKVGSIVLIQANLTATEVVDKTPKKAATPAATPAKDAKPAAGATTTTKQ